MALCGRWRWCWPRRVLAQRAATQQPGTEGFHAASSWATLKTRSGGKKFCSVARWLGRVAQWLVRRREGGSQAPTLSTVCHAADTLVGLTAPHAHLKHDRVADGGAVLYGHVTPL